MLQSYYTDIQLRSVDIMNHTKYLIHPFWYGSQEHIAFSNTSCNSPFWYASVTKQNVREGKYSQKSLLF